MGLTATSATIKKRRRSAASRESSFQSLLKLPPPTVERWDWQLAAACRGMESSLFFAPDGERSRARNRRIASAKAVCAGCPVRTDCRNYAIGAGETFGIWGGLTEDERTPTRNLTSTA
jgi:WhiB family redox-sensing transcriptional regulator